MSILITAEGRNWLIAVEVISLRSSQKPHQSRIPPIRQNPHPRTLKYFNGLTISHTSLPFLEIGFKGLIYISSIKSYGFKERDIAILFLTGFASSSTLGTLTGPITDKYGRKKSALAFYVVYSICCIIKTSRNFSVLLSGRLLGGISTSLLFTVFESWYVKEHKSRGYNDAWISKTSAFATFGNGLIAIIAGSFAIGYFMVLVFWNENYGDASGDLMASYGEGLRVIWNDKSTLYVGGVQSIFESCMYIFVFLWTPVLSDGPSGSAPLGTIFSCFMICIMIGSNIFSKLLSQSKHVSDTLFYALIFFAISTGVCSLIAGPVQISLFTNKLDTRIFVFLAFLLLEISVGIYFPSIGTLRSQVIPESHRATITNYGSVFP
ncbi:unnamed protein product [Lepeophtheirus salmonis]|uniref:Molybdate-anion transporter n=1 Tax=Lepeophtheirus salmonis TaxID=72036 RepID=A0A7R8CF41_LEPSM|nr:unnamed protein product [Lepeophtheirus salmonis]CAF2802894.1 unnamed protein product [Lepeophtheirus salmonis]